MKRIKKSSKDLQREVYALLDSASATLETLPVFSDGTLDLITKKSFAVSFSPLEYLFNILQIIGVDEETIKGWLVDIFTVALPAVEVSVKAELLNSLKGLIDCRIDPFIPENYRKPYDQGYFTPRGLKRVLNGEMAGTKGVIININAIDPDLMLSKSPLGEEGRELYFGQYHYNSDNVVESYDEDKNFFELMPTPEKVSTIPEVTVIGQRKVNPYEFVRAADFNAFLWLCIHKAKLPSPSVLEINGSTTTVGNCSYRVKHGKSLLDYLILERKNSEEQLSINIGATLTSRTNQNLLSLAIQSYPETKIVPVSSDWNSCNWYVDKKRYFKENLTSTISSERDYGNEFGVFNIKYMKPADYECRIGDFEGTENLLFTVLPAPYILTPTLFKKNNKENLLPYLKVSFSKILFNGNGDADLNGKYTINPVYLNFSQATSVTINGSSFLYIPFFYNGVPIQNRGLKYVDNENFAIVDKTSNYNKVTGINCERFLIECYQGLTIYELNYDYVMGMRLFDPQVLTKRLINNIFNPFYYSTFSYQGSNSSTKGGNAKADSASYVNAKYKILNMVKRIVEEEDELTDCFFSFTNEDYEEMLKQSAEARYHETPFRLWNAEGKPVDTTDIDRILGQYPPEGTLNEQRDIISKTLEQAMITAEEESNGGYSQYSKGSNNSSNSKANSSASRVQFATDMFSQLTSTLIDALITPKLLLILEVNKQMIGEDNASFTIDSLMNSMKNIVKAIIRELLDLIMQKMLDYIMSYIKSLIAELISRYAEEQIKAYLAILLGLLSFFRKGMKIANECMDRISSRFGSNGDVYNQAISEAANGINEFDFDLPTLGQNLNFFDTYIPENNDEPKISDC